MASIVRNAGTIRSTFRLLVITAGSPGVIATNRASGDGLLGLHPLYRRGELRDRVAQWEVAGDEELVPELAVPAGQIQGDDLVVGHLGDSLVVHVGPRLQVGPAPPGATRP